MAFITWLTPGPELKSLVCLLQRAFLFFISLDFTHNPEREGREAIIMPILWVG